MKKLNALPFIIKTLLVALIAGCIYASGFYFGYTQGQKEYQRMIRDNHPFMFPQDEVKDSVQLKKS
jgi:hypothetical protein